MGVHDIGPNVRRWMKIRGLTIRALSKKAGIGTAALSNLVNGKAEPKSSTLISLASSLGVPVHDLLFDAPKLQSLRFRSARSLSGREKAARDQLRHETALWLFDYAFLEDQLHEARNLKLSGINEPDPARAAVAARRILAIGARDPIEDLPRLMEDAGIRLAIHPFGFKKAFGLSVGDKDSGPAIVVNSEPGITVERQIFTIAHELGHLIMHKGSYDSVREEDDQIEEEGANAFAALFLMPDEGFRGAWEELSGLHWVDAVLRTKKVFKVSYMTVLMRLAENSSLESGQLIARFRMEFAHRTGRNLKDHYEPNAIEGPVARIDPSQLDASDLVEGRFARLVRKAYEEELISIGRAAEMLHKSLEEMRSQASAWREL